MKGTKRKRKKPKSEAPCPGCGQTDGLWVEYRPTVPALHYGVVCICGWEGPPRGTKEEAVEIWEARA